MSPNSILFNRILLVIVSFQTPELAVIWQEINKDKFLKTSTFLSAYNFHEGYKVLGLFTAMNYLTGVASVGVQVYMAFLPFTPFIRTEVFNMCMAALTLT
jgi:hypothetical protein